MDFNGTLSNGAELYTCLDSNLNGFALSLWIRRGAMHEAPGSEGLAHFLEHAIFRAISHRMGGRLYAELTRRGLSFDASTYANYVRFEISGLSDVFDEALDILMTVTEAPEMPIDALNMERRRVQTEIREEDGQESADAFANAHVWRGTRLARTLSGTHKNVNLFGFDALKGEHARWFSRGNFFFCATGNVPDVGKLKKRIEAIVPFDTTPVIESAPVPEAFFRRGAEVHVQDRGYTWVRFSFDVAAARHKEPAFMDLEEYLMGDVGMLYLSLSEDTALVYDITDYFERFKNIGCMSFDFEVEPSRLYEAVDVVVDALNALKHLDDDTLNGAKLGGVRNDRMKRNSVCTFNNIWGYDNGMRHCGFDSIEAREKAYLDVTADEMRAIARETFTPNNVVLCVRGNKRRIDEELLREKLMRLGDR